MHRFAGATLISVLCVLASAPAAAADRYPTRPIRLIVAFAPGGGNDIAARSLTDGLARELGQMVVVDNRPGAGSVVGTEIAARASADGYTLLMGNVAMAFNVALYRKLPFDTLRDFATISRVADQPNILVAHATLPAKSFKEFVALARAQPGKLTYGSAGLGSGTHLAMEMLMMSQGLSLVHVPYKGIGPAVTAVVGNQISVLLSTFASALPHVKAERLRSYGVTSQRRAPTLPEVPTLAEAGVPGYEYITWYGLLGPAGIPRPIVERLNQATAAALANPEIQQRYVSQGLDPRSSTPGDFAAHFKSEVEKWTKVVRAAKIEQQ
jgi:tripartite-type tricarboxylate transporter receptor subunit TctC